MKRHDDVEIGVKLSSDASEVTGYDQGRAVVFGILQMICGSYCFVLNVVQLSLGTVSGFVGIGIWGGIAIFCAGLFGLFSGKKTPTVDIIKAVQGLSILSILTALAGIGVNMFNYFSRHFDNTLVAPRYVTTSISIMVYLTELAVAIGSTVVCFKAVPRPCSCCGQPGNPPWELNVNYPDVCQVKTNRLQQQQRHKPL